MNRQFTNILITIAAAAVLAVGSYAFATVPNADFLITDKDDLTTQAFLDVDGSEFEVDIEASCAANTFLEAFTTHPDTVKLKKDKAEVGQTQKDNQAELVIVTASLDLNADAGILDIPVNRIECEKLEVEADVKDKGDGKGSFEASGKNCVCDNTFDDDDLLDVLDELDLEPGDFGDDVDDLIADNCTSYPAQITAATADCDGQKTVSGKFSDAQLQKFKIKGKSGTVVVLD